MVGGGGAQHADQGRGTRSDGQLIGEGVSGPGGRQKITPIYTHIDKYAYRDNNDGNNNSNA